MTKIKKEEKERERKVRKGERVRERGRWDVEREREREREREGRNKERKKERKKERTNERRRNEIALYIEIGHIVKTFKFRVKLSFYDMIEIEIGTWAIADVCCPPHPGSLRNPDIPEK